MHRLHLALIAIVLASAGCQQPVEATATEPPLTNHALSVWFGEWQGEMVNLRGGKPANPIPVALRIRPLADGTIEWRTLYNNDLDRGLKDYRLIPDPSDSSKYTMDEQNGIMLPLRLLDDVMLGPFELGGLRFLSRYFIDPGHTLRHEVIVWNDETSTTSSIPVPAGTKSTPVISFEVSTVQRTIFRRVSND